MIERIIRYAIPLSLLLLSACSQEDEPAADARQIEFAVSISEMPQSRVSETADGMGSSWSNGDRIFVKVTQGGATGYTYCTLNAGGKVTAYSKNLFWNGTGQASVVAYFSNIAKRNPTATATVDLADQSNGLAYVLRATATANYGPSIPLTFSHQLAKVRVKIEGDKATEVTTVKINNYSSCKIDETGYVTAETPGYITMRKNGDYFEANVVPDTNNPAKLLDFGDDFNVDVSGISAFEAGKVYTITIDASTPIDVETTINGHEAVLMRKSPALYFAKTNIGASTPEDPGLHFWWGDVVGYNSVNDFSFNNSNTSIVTYNKTITELYNGNYITTDNTETAVLRSEYDAAHAQWKGSWRMPTKDEFKWLVDNCIWAWWKGSGENLSFSNSTSEEDKFTVATPYPGVAGCYVKSKETNQIIFLPAAGTFNNGTHNFNGESGCCWSASHRSTASYAEYLRFASSSFGVSKEVTNMNVYIGASIRPVSENK